jgi:hypothetical protein
VKEILRAGWLWIVRTTERRRGEQWRYGRAEEVE